MMLIASGITARARSLSCRPSAIRMRVALGDSCRPAPASSSRAAFSRTTTRKPFAASASAAVSPPIPAPAMTMVRFAATERSGGLVLDHAFRRTRLAGAEIGGIAVQRRAIRADDLVVVAEIEEHMRMIERRIGAHAHEFVRADLDYGDAGVIVEVRNHVIGHIFPLCRNDVDAIGLLHGERHARNRPDLAIAVRKHRLFAHVNSTQSTCWEKPSFRRGSCVAKAAHLLSGRMKGRDSG